MPVKCHQSLTGGCLRKMRNTLQFLKERYKNSEIDYDVVSDFIEGWIAYAKNANTYNLRKNILTDFEREFSREISIKEINRYLNIRNKKIMPLTQTLKIGTAFISQICQKLKISEHTQKS